MAGAKVLKKRISVVKNTRKITRTMEMVSTAKAKRMVNRVNSARPYNEKITEVLESLEHLAGESVLPLLRKTENPPHVALLVVTANRGLCGGYNSNVLRQARLRLVHHQKRNRKIDLYVVGKKGNSYFKFIKVPVKQAFLNVDDSLQYDTAKNMADHFIGEFSYGQFDRLEVISTVYLSSAVQKPVLDLMLPVGADAVGDKAAHEAKRAKPKKNQAAFLFDPDEKFILKRILPHIVRARLFRKLLEAVTSEQIARRVAMKNATDNAGEMGKMLGRTYNRKRQAGITQELSEIVSGADAVG